MRWRFLFILLGTTLLAGNVRAAGFDPLLLSIGEGEIRAVRAADLTGDGMSEILAFADAPGGPQVAVFLADGKGRYAPEPGIRIPLGAADPSGIYYATVARLAPERPSEILVVDRERGLLRIGLVRDEEHRWRATEPVRLSDAPPLPFPPDDAELSVLDVGADLDGDGGDEVVLPSATGFTLLRFGEDGMVSSTDSLDLAPRLAAEEADHRFLTLRWELPRLTVADWDGDGLPDLVGALTGRLVLFLQTGDGGFFEVSQPLDLLAEGPVGGDRAEPVLGDVDGDGRVDLVVATHASRLDPLDRFETSVSLYPGPRILSPEEDGKLSTPAGAFRVDGVGVNPELMDFDGDGRLDLLLTCLDITPGARLRKQVNAEYRVHRFDPETGRFDPDPYFTVTRPFPVGQLERESTAPVCFFSGDFDGDGRKDLLDIADEGGIAILPGTRDTGIFSTARYGFGDEAIFRAKASVTNDVLVTRLGGRAADDAIAFRGSRVYLIRRAP